MQAPLIDSHCHLNYDYSPKSREQIIQEALDAGVVGMVTIGTEAANFQELQTIAEAHPSVVFTVGVHPHDSGTMKDEDLSSLERFAAHPKCRAIGEIGLDYYYENSDRAQQCKRLEEQLDLALRVKLPIVIHSRDGEADLLPLLKSYANKAPGEPGVIHCFSGSDAFGRACLDLGFYLSLSGILTFKNAEDLRSSAKSFPLDRLLVETDSPFLAPIPFRGKKCEPSMVKLTAMKLAELQGVAFEKVAEVTTENARRIFFPKV